MKIEVTQRHINLGVRCSANNCPVALALTEQTGKTYTVGPRDVYVFDWATNKHTLAFPTPPEVARFIRGFDILSDFMGNPKPFTFELPEGVTV